MTRGRPLALALRALGLGDFLTALPAIRACARALPDHELALAAPAALGPLAVLVPEIDTLVPAAPLAALPERRRVDVALNLHGRGPESHRVLLALAPRRLVAFQNDAVPESAGGPRFDPAEHEVRRWCRLTGAAGMPADPEDLALRIDDAPLGPGGHAVVHPGAAVAGRRWPPERFAAVARALVRRGRPVVVSAGPGEEALARDVVARAGLPASALFAERDLRALARLVHGAAVVVCGDTGVGHLATACGTPSVLLFGPTPPALWGPPASRPWHRVLHRGGRGDPHGAGLDPALAAITVEDVVAEIDALAAPAAASA